MWSTLALLTTMTGEVPPFLLVALAFAIAFAVTLARWVWQGGGLVRRFRWPVRAWLLGVGGLFGYHFFYFLALRSAPPAEASLVNYLWPLLIVLLSALLPGRPAALVARRRRAVRACRNALLVTDGGGIAFPPNMRLATARRSPAPSPGPPIRC